MGLKLYTNKISKYRYLTITESDNLNFLFYRSEYNSYFPFAYKDPDSDKLVGYAGSLCSLDYEDDTLDDSLPNIDLYICANGMKVPHKRASEYLINIQNLVIDIDSHNSNLSTEQLQEHIKKFKEILLNKIKTKPNFVNLTGRGLHLWFCIEPCHVSLHKICLNVIEMICNDIKAIMSEINETELAIDYAASSRLNGIFRVPYSYNTKSKSWSEGYMLHTELPNIINLANQLQSYKIKSKYIKDKTDKKNKSKSVYHPTFKKSIRKNDYTPCLIHRKKFLDYVAKTREMKKETTRDLVIFAMYATMIQLCETEDARQYCLDINDNFIDPLTYGEMICIFKEVDKKQHIFTVEKLFRFIEATPDEIDYFNTSTIKKEKQQAKRDAKEERNKKILNLYEQGMKQTEIAKLLDISRKTVYNVINNT